MVVMPTGIILYQSKYGATNKYAGEVKNFAEYEHPQFYDQAARPFA